MIRSLLLQIHKNNYLKIVEYLNNSEINKNYKYEYLGIIKNNNIYYIHLKCYNNAFSNLIYNFGNKSYITSMSDIEHNIMTSVNFYFRFLSNKNFSQYNFITLLEYNNIDNLEKIIEEKEFIKQSTLKINPNYCYINTDNIIYINNPFGESKIKVNNKIHLNC